MVERRSIIMWALFFLQIINKGIVDGLNCKSYKKSDLIHRTHRIHTFVFLFAKRSNETKPKRVYLSIYTQRVGINSIDLVCVHTP
jgi:hypothetical protein